MSDLLSLAPVRDSRPTTVLMRQRMMVQRNEGETAESERMPRYRGLNLVVTKLEFQSLPSQSPGGRGKHERRTDAMVLSLTS